LTPEQTIEKMAADATLKGFGKPAEATPVEPAKPAETPAVAADPAKPAEVAKPTDASQDTPSYSLEEDGYVGAKDLAARPEIAALPQNVRDEVLANARIAETLAPFRERFSSIEEADVVIQTAQEFAGFSEAFSSIAKDATKGTTSLVQKLIEGSALRDAEGNPLKNPDGSLRTDGTALKFFKEIGNRAIALEIVNKVKALNDPNVEAALDLVMESVGLRPSTATEDKNLDPVLAARKAELDAQEARIKADRERSSQETVKAYSTALETELSSTYDGERKALLDAATGLTSFERSSVETQLDAAVIAARKKNVAYNERLRIIRQQPMSAERRQREVALAKTFLRENLSRIAKPILTAAGVTVGAKAAERAAAQAARAADARSEVSGSAASLPATSQNPGATYEQQRAQAVAELKTKNGGREPDDSEVSIQMMIAAAERKGFGKAA
jgi:hypothetical protein